ncbi:MAG: hypothetical protein ABII75_03765 [Candidatus Omnitrophota bacterium]
MNRCKFWYIFLIVIAAVIFATYDISFAQEAVLEVVVEVNRMVYRMDEEITATVYIKNKCTETLEVTEPALDSRSLEIEIVQPDAKRFKLLNIQGINLKKIRLYPEKRIKFIAKFIPELLGEFQIAAKYYGFEDIVLVSNAATIFVIGTGR